MAARSAAVQRTSLSTLAPEAPDHELWRKQATLAQGLSAARLPLAVCLVLCTVVALLSTHHTAKEEPQGNAAAATSGDLDQSSGKTNLLAVHKGQVLTQGNMQDSASIAAERARLHQEVELARREREALRKEEERLRKERARSHHAATDRGKEEVRAEHRLLDEEEKLAKKENAAIKKEEGLLKKHEGELRKEEQAVRRGDLEKALKLRQSEADLAKGEGRQIGELQKLRGKQQGKEAEVDKLRHAWEDAKAGHSKDADRGHSKEEKRHKKIAKQVADIQSHWDKLEARRADLAHRQAELERRLGSAARGL